MKIFFYSSILTKFTIVYFLFLPFALILGNLTINLLIYSYSIFLLIIIINSRQWDLINKDFRNLFILTWIYLILITIFIHDQSLKGIIKSIGFGLNFIFAIGLAIYLNQINLKIFKIISFIFISLTIFIYVDLLYQFLNPEFKDLFGFKVNTIRNYTLFGKDVNLPIRLSGPFKNELVPGFFLSTFGFFSIFFFFHFNHFKNNYLFLIFIFLNFSFVILSGERSSVIMSFFTLICFFLIYDKFRFKKFYFIFAIIIILLSFIKFNPATNERFKDIILWAKDDNFIFKNTETNQDLKEYSKVVQNFFKTDWGKHYFVAIKIIKDEPFFGKGIRSFREECKKYDEKSCTTHPHHFILEILSETGVFFLILYTFLIFKVILYYWNLKEKKNYFNLGSLLIFLSYLFPFRPTGAIFSSWYGSFFWILLSLYIFSCINKIEENEEI